MLLKRSMLTLFEENKTDSQIQDIIVQKTLTVTTKAALTANARWVRHLYRQEVNVGSVSQTSWWSMLLVSDLVCGSVEITFDNTIWSVRVSRFL